MQFKDASQTLDVSEPLTPEEWNLLEVAISLDVASEEGNVTVGAIHVQSADWETARKLQERGFLKFVGNQTPIKVYTLTELGRNTFHFFNEVKRWRY